MMLTFMTTTLNKTVRCWSIDREASRTTVRYGSFGSTSFVEEIFEENETAYRKRIRDKLKSGYVGVSKLPDKIEHAHRIIKEFSDKLPFKNPMKCQKYSPVKFIYPCSGQPKFNGVRCYIIWGEWIEGDGLFKERKEGVMLLSSEGNRYFVPHVAKCFKKSDFYSIGSDVPDIYFDGELYVHGEKLNTIKSRIPIEINGVISTPSLPVDPIKFYCFDIAIEDVIYEKRRLNRFDIFHSSDRMRAVIPTNSCVYVETRSSKAKGLYDIHYIGTSPIVYVHDTKINNYAEAEEFIIDCIANGFEGAVFRSFENTYQYGKRPSDIIKAKKFVDGEFEVVDIILVQDGQYGCMFICRNDINSSTFECNPTGTYEKQNKHHANRDKIIGKLVTVRYYERSGVKKCPFHANVVTVRDYE